MSPRKLTEENKQEILRFYRSTDETTSTLATRYEVSSSTISRFLKSHLSTAEYEDLIQQKRLGRTLKEESESISPTSDSIELPIRIPVHPLLVEKSVAPPEISEVSLRDDVELFDEDEEIESVDVTALREILGEDLGDLDEDEDEDDLADEEDEEWEDEGAINYPTPLSTHTDVQVLPFSAASFPKTCYLVIDRASELITRPLKEFADLGKIPAEEIQQRTLPVFDNHRIARRFSNRSQRVIKVPDGRMLQKTRPYLKAKGITRLLMDGHIYSFEL
jgi:transposase-like protein